MKLIVGIRNSRLDSIREIAEIGLSAALAVGDPFCQKRVGPCGMLDIAEGCRLLKMAGHEVVLVTPVYTTDSILQDNCHLIDMLYRQKCLDGIFLHDLGLLEHCRAYKDVLYLIWDRYGFGRDYRLNLPTLNILNKQGIKGVEIWRQEDASLCLKEGLNPHLSVVRADVRSFGRRCYTEYLGRQSCSGGLCQNVSEASVLVDNNTGEKFWIDGHQLIGESSTIFLPHLSGRMVEGLNIIAWVDGLIELEKAIAEWAPTMQKEKSSGNVFVT